jgi:hypothetical protein
MDDILAAIEVLDQNKSTLSKPWPVISGSTEVENWRGAGPI